MGHNLRASHRQEAGIGAAALVVVLALSAVLVVGAPDHAMPWWPWALAGAALLIVWSEGGAVALGLGADSDLRMSATPAVLLAAVLLVPPSTIPLLVLVPVACGLVARHRSWPRLAVSAALDLVGSTAAVAAASIVWSAAGSVWSGAAEPLALWSGGLAWCLANAAAVTVLCRAALGTPIRMSPVLSRAALVPMGVQAVLGVAVAQILRTSIWALPLAALLLWVNVQYVASLSAARSSRADDKTGMPRYADFMAAAAREVARAERTHRPLSVLMLDLDHFREVNSRHGHLVGDDVLAEVGQRIRIALRLTDIAARFGGEEFSVLLPDSDADRARIVAERIRLAIGEEPVDAGGVPVRVTVSIGVTELVTGEPIAEAMQRADRALYSAKRSGRDRVCSEQYA